MKNHMPVMLLCAAVVALQLAFTLSGVGYYLTQLTMAAWYSLVVLGLCMLMGYAGQISLGHAAFFAIGGYTSALLTTINLMPFENSGPVAVGRTVGLVLHMVDPYGRQLLYINPWLALAVAVAVSALVALVIGTPVLKLRGHYLAMATLGFGVIIFHVILGTRGLGEADGISSVPPFVLFPGVTISGSRSVRVLNYYIAWAAVVGALLLLLNLVDSRIGRALRAIHGNEEAASAMGVDTARLKLTMFVVSAVMAAVGGACLTHFNGGIGPSEAGVMKSVRYVAIVAVGGMSNLWGALLFGVLLNFLSLRGYFGLYDDAVFGAILAAVMMFAPRGFLTVRLPGGIGKFLGRRGGRGPS